MPGTVEAARELAQTVGQPLRIAHFYAREGEAVPTQDQIDLAHGGADAPILFLNVKPEWISPGNTLTWREVAEGGADAYLDQIAKQIVALDRPMFLTLHHEPEDDVSTKPGSGYTPQDYAQMYRPVVNYVTQAVKDSGSGSTPQPVWVWDHTGYPRWAPMWKQLYPGDDVVDWIAYDPYLMEPYKCEFSCVANRTYPQEYSKCPGFYAWAQQTHPDKPLMLAEWGVQESLNPGIENAKADLFASAPGVLQASFPNLKALVYFNDDKSQDHPTASRIDTTHQSLAAFQQMAANQYFQQPAVP